MMSAYLNVVIADGLRAEELRIRNQGMDRFAIAVKARIFQIGANG
jgi:hypothetical protein